MTNLTHGWTVSAKDRQFSIATVTHFGCGLTFADIGTLLAENPEAFNSFLEDLGAAMAKKFGNEDLLVHLLALYADMEVMIGPPRPFDKETH